MVCNKKCMLGVRLIGFLGLACAAGQMTAVAQKKTAEPPRVDSAVTKAVRRNFIRADRTKEAAIEPPARAVVQHKSAAPAGSSIGFVNARVPPGKVHWHAGFAEACQAAQKSHKPVLLFHMMGKLDDLFC